MFKKNKRLIVIAAVTLVGALGYGIVIPVLYPYSMKFGLSDFENGALFAVYSICMFIATPLIGRLSDKYGRRPLLIISLIGTAGSFFLMAFAPNAVFLFLARALDGFTAGNMPVAQAVISDTTEGPDRTRGFGIIGACFGAGFIAGPAISAISAGVSLSLPFIIAGIISLVAVGLAIFLLDETNRHIGQVVHKKMFNFKKMFSALADKQVGSTLLICFLWAFALGMFIFGFQPLAVKVLHLNEKVIALIFTLFGAVGLFSQLFLVARTSKAFGVLKTFSYALVTLTFGFALLSLTGSVALLVTACIVVGLSNSTIQTLIQTIISHETESHKQGEILGINASFMSLGQILGPLLAGAVALISIHYPFVLAAVLVFTAFIISRKIKLNYN